jgi:hypothetical protein
MARMASYCAAVAVLLGGCSSNGPSAGGGSGGGFPEKGFGMVADKAKKGDDALDQATIRKALEAQKQIASTGFTLKDERRLTPEEKVTVESAAKAAGFSDIKEFYKASDALDSTRHVLFLIRKLESGSPSDFQKAVVAELVKDFTEADLRFVAGLK